MSSLGQSVDNCLKNMHGATQTGKGSYGEQAVFKICEQFYQREGGILYHSYTYRVDETKAGNIKKDENGKPYVENLGSSTEIDVLYVSPYRLYAIEVKAYKAKHITLTDDGISGCYKTDKSPVHQNEMHMRHLYAELFMGLPKGNTDYCTPLVCFVDKCTVEDNRSDWQKQYIPVTVLNGLRPFIKATDKPIENRLDLNTIQRILNEMMISCDKHLPLRL